MFPERAKKVEKSHKAYKNNYALIFGNGNYIDISPIPYTAEVTNEIAALLRENFEFNILPKGEVQFDLDGPKIINSIKNALDVVGSEDSLFIYISSHGGKIKNSGYIIPVSENSKASANWISAEDIIDLCLKFSAKDIVLALDICFAGAFLNSFIHNKSQVENRSFMILLAGTEMQTVPADSLFAKYMIKGLMGYAGEGDKQFFSTFELFEYISESIARIPEQKHKPIFDYIVREKIQNQDLHFHWKEPKVFGRILRELEDTESRLTAIQSLSKYAERPDLVNDAVRLLIQLFSDQRFQNYRDEVFETIFILETNESNQFILQTAEQIMQVEGYIPASSSMLATIRRTLERINDIQLLPKLLEWYARWQRSPRPFHNPFKNVIGVLLEVTTENQANITKMITDILDTDDFIETRSHCINFLGKIKSVEADMALLKFARDNWENHDELNNQHVEALSELAANGVEESIPQIDEILSGSENLPKSYQFWLNDIINWLKGKYGLVLWEESELLWDLSYNIPVMKFSLKNYDQAVDLDEGEIFPALVDIVINPELSIGERTISAIALKGDIYDECRREDLIAGKSQIQKFIEVSNGQENMLIPHLSQAVSKIEAQLQ